MSESGVAEQTSQRIELVGSTALLRTGLASALKPLTPFIHSTTSFPAHMTSPVPLRPYHQHSSLGDYTDSDTIAASNSKGSAQSYEDDIDLYDPYDTPPARAKSWGHTAFEESATDGINKPSLSYDTKELGK